MSQLLPREWLALGVVAGLLATLSLTVVLNRPGRLPDVGEPVSLFLPQTVEVEILGAVAHGGLYSLDRGATLADLLALSIPLEGADLRGFDLEHPLRNRQRIEIRRGETIEVELFGEGVRPELVRLPDGATVGDLLKLAELEPDAALWRLRKRQLLHDGDRIEIRKKRQKVR